MFKSRKTWLTMLLVLSFSLILAACGGGGDTEQPSGDAGDLKVELGQKKITVPYVAWAREAISTHILAELLKDIGYDVDVRQVEAGPMWASVADGSADFHTSAWLPATHQDYWEQYEGDIVKVVELIDKAPLALAVPAYVEDVNSMEDLKSNTAFGDAVDWTITGIDAGAGIMSNTNLALEEYGLDNWKLTESSESAMLTELKKAYENEEPIIVPLWKPHWVFGVYDMKMLEDPKEVYGGEGDQIYTVARAGLEEDAPAAYKLLEQYTEDYEMLEELMPKVWQDDRDAADVAREFIDNNPELVAQWMDGIK